MPSEPAITCADQEIMQHSLIQVKSTDSPNLDLSDSRSHHIARDVHHISPVHVEWTAQQTVTALKTDQLDPPKPLCEILDDVTKGRTGASCATHMGRFVEILRDFHLASADGSLEGPSRRKIHGETSSDS